MRTTATPATSSPVPSTFRGRRTALALTAASVLLGGCGMASAATPGPVPQHRVIVLGDSIIAGSEVALRDAIPGVVVDGVGGRGPDANFLTVASPTLRQAVTTSAPLVAPGGFLVVQDDGGNPISAEFVRYVTDQLADDRTLVWVSPSNPNAPTLAQSRAAVKAGILAQPANTYVDWEATVARDPAGLVVDGVHPTELGKSVLASMVREATS